MEKTIKETPTGKMNIKDNISRFSTCHNPKCGKFFVSGHKGTDYCPHCFISGLWVEINSLKDERIELKDEIKTLKTKPKRKPKKQEGGKQCEKEEKSTQIKAK